MGSRESDPRSVGSVGFQLEIYLFMLPELSNYFTCTKGVKSN